MTVEHRSRLDDVTSIKISFEFIRTTAYEERRNRHMERHPNKKKEGEEEK